jgi:threonine/homoserine/homoserine lactone efflux protein
VVTALIVFSFVSSVTPGPNNVVLWASGARFGFRPTLPHVAGTALGIGAMAAGAAAGLGVVVTAVPVAALVLRVAGSVYLLYLAYRIAASRAMQRPDVASPLGLGQAALFQCVNPKAWIFVLAAVSTFRPNEVPIAVGSALVVVTMMVVVLPTAAVWATAGTVIGRIVTGDRAHRALSAGLAVILAASVVHLWI